MSLKDRLRVGGLVAAILLGIAATCASPAFAQQAQEPTSSGTTVAQNNPFSDVPANSWAYQAVKALAADGLIEGYPNGKFEGNRPMTRYEMAVLVNRAVDKMEANIAAGQKANAADIAALKKLVDAFGPEIAAIQNHLATLDKQVADVAAATAANTATLKRAQFHLYSFLRGPGSYGGLTSAFAGPAGVYPARDTSATTTYTIANTSPGGALPPATPLKFNDAIGNPGGVGAQDQSYTGQYTYGTAYMVNRLVFSGDVDANNSYAVRLEDRYYIELPNYGAPEYTTGNAGSQPVYCTSLSAQGTPFGSATTCALNTDYPNNTTFRLNYAYYTWHPPGGFYVQAGRLVQGDGSSDLGGQPPNLLYSDYFNGALLGYYGPPGGMLPTLRVEAGVGFGTPTAQLSSALSLVNQVEVWGQISYDFIPHHLNIGIGGVTETGNSATYWDPSAPILALSSAASIPGFAATKGAPILNPTTGTPITGLYCGVSATAPGTGCPAFFGANDSFGSVFFTYRLSDYLHVNAEAVHHFGNDPFTGATFQQPNGFWGIVTLGNNAGPKGSAWAEAGYIGTGFNGESPEGGITSTTPPTFFAPYISNPAGYYFYYGGIHYHVANNVDIGIIALHGDVLNGTAIPASSQQCPGCFITHDVKNAIMLQTLFAF